jgi:hypothetical protein
MVNALAVFGSAEKLKACALETGRRPARWKKQRGTLRRYETFSQSQRSTSSAR